MIAIAFELVACLFLLIMLRFQCNLFSHSPEDKRNRFKTQRRTWRRSEKKFFTRVSIITTVVSIRFILFRMYFYELTDPLLNLIYNFIVIVWFQFNAMETVLFALNIQTKQNRDRQRKGTSANVLVDCFFLLARYFDFFPSRSHFFGNIYAVVNIYLLWAVFIFPFVFYFMACFGVLIWIVALNAKGNIQKLVCKNDVKTRPEWHC